MNISDSDMTVHNFDSDLTDQNPAPAVDKSEGKRFRLRKAEKLRHRSLVDPLFKEGKTLYEFPLRLTWRALDGEALAQSFRDSLPDHIGPVQMLITVPKKKRRHAVDRVLMRRRIREAYRLNRLPLKTLIDGDDSVKTLGLAFIYLHDKNLPYSTIESKMKILLKKLSAKLKG